MEEEKKETRKCIEIYITRTEGSDEQNVEFRNIIKDTEEDKEWFQSASDIMKQVAYVLYKIHENDIEETEVNYVDDEQGTTSE